MKKSFVFLVSLILVLSAVLAGCGGGGNEQTEGDSGNANDSNNGGKKLIVKFAHANSTETSLHKGAEKFKELVEQKSNGQIEVQLFPASQLGNEKDLVEGTKLGTVHITPPSVAMMGNFSPKANVFTLPYIINGSNERERFETLKKLAQSEVYQEIIKEAEAQGLLVFGESVWWYGDRHITSKNKPVQTPADLKGLKIRTPDAKAHTEPFKLLGANVTPMALSELYVALKTGAVEAQENPINTIYAFKFYEVQKYLSLTGHMTQFQIPAISLKWWNTLTPEQQKLIKESIIEAGEYQSELQLKANEEQVEVLKQKGMEVVQPDINAFKEATKDVYKSFSDKFDESFYNKVKELQN